MQPNEAPLKFWKFEYDGSVELRKCIAERRLPVPKEVPGLSNTYDYPAKTLRAGDGVILAKLDGETARIYAVGKVRCTVSGDKPTIVDWTEVRDARFPNPQGGLQNWRTKTAFEIKPNPANRYGLRELIEHHVHPYDIQANEEHFESDSAKAIEGYLLDRKLLTSARNTALATKRKELDNFLCQACNFRLQIGNKYVVDAHHLNPLRDSGETTTTLEDLVSLCPTCHRIAHLRTPPYSVKEIQEYRNGHNEDA